MAAVDAVRATTGIRAGLKWPNDIPVGGASWAESWRRWPSPDPVIVVGLGPNVSLDRPGGGDPRATSPAIWARRPGPHRAAGQRAGNRWAARIDCWRAAGGAGLLALVADYRGTACPGTQVRAELPASARSSVSHRISTKSDNSHIDTGLPLRTAAVAAGDHHHLRNR